MKAVYTTIYFLIVFITFCDVRGTIVSQCEDGAFPDSVEIENCDQQPCILYIGNQTSMTMHFKAPRHLENITARAVAKILGLAINYPLGQDDACVGITNRSCPLDEGDDVEYTYSIDILAIFPQITLDLEFSLVDVEQENAIIECFSVNITTVAQP